MPEKQLLETMAQYKYFVFFPQVLETLSRITVEAKMLGCKVLTKAAMLGAASEEWFQLTGLRLFEKITEQRNLALDKFVDILEDK